MDYKGFKIEPKNASDSPQFAVFPNATGRVIDIDDEDKNDFDDVADAKKYIDEHLEYCSALLANSRQNKDDDS